MRLVALLLVLTLATPAVAETRRIPFWPGSTTRVVSIDGGEAIEAATCATLLGSAVAGAVPVIVEAVALAV